MDADPDDELLAEAAAAAAAAGSLPGAPLVLRLTDAGVVAVTGDRAAALALVRAALLELALTCAPDDLCLVAAYPPAEVYTWAWVKWLPHTAAGTPGTLTGPAGRLLATSAEELEAHLDAVVAPRLRLLEERTWATSQQAFARAVVLVDRYDPLTELGLAGTLTKALARAAEVGVTVLALCDPGAAAPTETTALVTVSARADGVPAAVLRRLGTPSAPVPFTPLAATTADADRLARRLAPKRLVADSIRAGRSGSGRLVDLLARGLLQSAQDSGSASLTGWPVLAPQEMLRVPFAVTAEGAPLELDLKESSEGGHGPHGLVIGAVGSGKSELLRTLVSGLAATHGPDDVELAFADFKGGLTFSLLQQVPHCSGMITNLADDLTLVDRMKAALAGELERRQQLLRAAGSDVQKISQYRALRAGRPDLPAMPYLVVVVDEFGELLEARPDVLEVLLSIGRTGRSLGVHLVLASQRLETGRTRGLDSYLGYRICLRTFTPEDSLAVLGSRAAADLPALPGHGYLRTASGLVRFLAATVSTAHQRASRPAVVRSYATGDSRPSSSAPVARAAQREETSDLAVLVREAGRAGDDRRRPPLWLPPLPRPDQAEPLTLDDPRLGGALPPAGQGLPVATGIVDLPATRRQVPLLLDPAALDGHLMVVGAPRTGKSTALAAYAVQAARRHPASLLRFHVVDLGGGSLAPLAGLPNVASCVDGQDPDAVRRVLLELERLIDDRTRRLRARGVHSAARWRELVAAGEVEGPAHTVLLLDQLVSFRERFADLDATFGRLLVEGPSSGVHVVLTSARWAELPAKRLEQVSSRIELRLNDAMESQHSRAVAGAVPAGVPGRGLLADGSAVQLAAPGDGRAPGDLAGAVARAAAQAQARWPGVTAPPLRRLADLGHADWAEAHHQAAADRGLLLGVAESGFDPVRLEPGALGAVLVYGDPGSGRSLLLARLLAQAAALPESARPQIYVLDYLGALLDRCDDRSAVVAAAYGPHEAPEVLGALVEELTRRQGAVAAARREGVALRHPAPVWLVADDYELVHAAARPGMATDLANLVPYAAKLALGVVVNQTAAGSGARVDPLVRRLLESLPRHLQFSVESRMELLLKGTRGVPLPPGHAVLTRPGQGDALVQVLPPRPAVADTRARIRLVS
jgi:S-DNA-T family DNA segregation ATPase FtsK/SpoIIIE